MCVCEIGLLAERELDKQQKDIFCLCPQHPCRCIPSCAVCVCVCVCVCVAKTIVGFLLFSYLEKTTSFRACREPARYPPGVVCGTSTHMAFLVWKGWLCWGCPVRPCGQVSVCLVRVCVSEMAFSAQRMARPFPCPHPQVCRETQADRKKFPFVLFCPFVPAQHVCTCTHTYTNTHNFLLAQTENLHVFSLWYVFSQGSQHLCSVRTSYRMRLRENNLCLKHTHTHTRTHVCTFPQAGRQSVYFSGDESLKERSNFCLVLTMNRENFLPKRECVCVCACVCVFQIFLPGEKTCIDVPACGERPAVRGQRLVASTHVHTHTHTHTHMHFSSCCQSETKHFSSVCAFLVSVCVCPCVPLERDFSETERDQPT